MRVTGRDDTTEDLGMWAERLRADRRRFVTATVVRAERPTSARPGDNALVLDDGTMLGFVGGECAQASVQAQAREVLASGDPVLLRITPEAADVPSAPETGAVTVHNHCLSGGALEVFLEPSLPPALVVVHGDAPIARAVRDLATWLGLDARSAHPGGDDPPDVVGVVIATHGGDEAALIEAALRAGVGYVGLVASRRRGEAVLSGLALEPAERARVHTPAGLDIGSRGPREIALSILAEIMSLRPRTPRFPAASPPTPPTTSD